MAADVAGAKTRRHVVANVHPTWRMRMHVFAYVHVCAYVCACVISEIKHPFQDFH